MNNEKYYLLTLVLTLMALEYFFPRRIYKLINRHRLEDLAWVFIHEVVFVFLLAGVMYKTHEFINQFFTDNFYIVNLQTQSSLFQVVFLFIVLDFISYWSHRSFHVFRSLWSLHRLHHTTTELTALSVFRQSWGEAILQGFFMGFFSGWFSVDPKLQSFGYMLFITACLIQHSNIRFPAFAFIQKILITPRNHMWHHSTEKHRMNGQNFGLVLTVWDRLFKTHYNPEHFETKIGLNEEYDYGSFFKRTIHPLDQIPSLIVDKFKKYNAKK